MEKDDVVKLKIQLFERYPDTSGSRTWFDARLPRVNGLYVTTPVSRQNSAPVDLNVTSAQLFIRDLVSGKGLSEAIDYNATIVAPSPESGLLIGGPVDYPYTMKAGNPRVDWPYNWPFQVTVQRNGVEGYSIANKYWYVPILGVSLKKMPNVYTVSSDPNLIYMVLRDPPGGMSFTTISQGSSAGFSIAINGMFSFDATQEYEGSVSLGIAGVFGKCVGVGVSVCYTNSELDVSAISSASTIHAASVERSSEVSYDYAMSFSYDISTSADPMKAGHPSDVIIGGGVDLYVNEAMQVFRYRKQYYDRNLKTQIIVARALGQVKPNAKVAEELVCLAANVTLAWQPGKVTTFVMPVMEVEKTVIKLGNLLGLYNSAKNSKGEYIIPAARQLNYQINNWNSVLSNYRTQNNDATKIFTSDNLQFQNMVQMYKKFSFDGITKDDLIRAYDGSNINEVIKDPFSKASVTKDPMKMLYGKAFVDTSTVCKNVIPGHRNAYLESICSDFDPKLWKTVYDVLTQPCDMPGSPVQSKMTGVAGRKLGGVGGADVVPGNSSVDNAFERRNLAAATNLPTFSNPLGLTNPMEGVSGVAHPLRESVMFKQMCTNSAVLDKNADAAKKLNFPGSVTGSLSDQGFFDFLIDAKTKFLTAYANSPMALSWTGSISDSYSYSTGLSENAEGSLVLGMDMSFKIGEPVTVHTANGFSAVSGSMRAFAIGKSSATSHDHERTVSFVLDDEDAGDFFVIRITEDKYFGTPIFTVMGGSSKCPGETGTSMRESDTTIMEIRYRCGPTKDMPCNLVPWDEKAALSVVIQNLSPTNDTVYYDLGLSNFYDKFEQLNYGGDDDSIKGYCGTPGMRAGLYAKFMEASMLEIGYAAGQLVEIPFEVKRTSFCAVFTDVDIDITASCEVPDTKTHVYKYNSKYDPKRNTNTLDYSDILNEEASAKTFSVTFVQNRRVLAAEGVLNPSLLIAARELSKAAGDSIREAMLGHQHFSEGNDDISTKDLVLFAVLLSLVAFLIFEVRSLRKSVAEIDAKYAVKSGNANRDSGIV